jgi:hypothetical protein
MDLRTDSETRGEFMVRLAITGAEALPGNDVDAAGAAEIARGKWRAAFWVAVCVLLVCAEVAARLRPALPVIESSVNGKRFLGGSPLLSLMTMPV